MSKISILIELPYTYTHYSKGFKVLLYILTFMFIRMEIIDKDFTVGYVSGF